MVDAAAFPGLRLVIGGGRIAATVWDFLADEAVPFMAAAVRVWGAEVLAGDHADSPAGSDREAVGRELLRLFFGGQHDSRQLPEPVADLLADPDSDGTMAGLVEHVEGTVEADPGRAAAAVEMITGFYQRQAEAGNAQALVDLGDFLYWDAPELARATYQEAVDAGHRHAMLDLAKVLHVVIEDHDAALAVYRQAIDSGDSGLAGEAMIELARMQLGRDDAPAARAAYQQAIGIGHPDWAPAAMVGLARMELARRDASAARAAYQQAIGTGHPDWAPAAMVSLADLHVRLDDLAPAQSLYQRAIEAGNPDLSARASLALSRLLKKNGDLGGAKAAWRRVIDSPDAQCAGPALMDLVNLLRDDDDIDGLRAAYRAGTEQHNPDALYALDALGQHLEQRGDIQAAHAAWQQAIDGGYEYAGELRERISPPPEPAEEPLDEIDLAPPPPEFDPKNMRRTGIDVLDHGLPALPQTLTHQMAIPLAYWTASQNAVVLFLQFDRARNEWDPLAVMATFTRERGQWTAASGHWHGTGFHDPFTDPGDRLGLDGQPIVISGGSHSDQPVPGRLAGIWHGTAAPAVRQIALIQDGHEDRRPLDSHFGAWIVCTEHSTPCNVTALDQNDAVLGSIQLAEPPLHW
jgi:DnaJ-domain-containing protein 1